MSITERDPCFSMFIEKTDLLLARKEKLFILWKDNDFLYFQRKSNIN